MDRQQQERFKRAVERKERDANLQAETADGRDGKDEPAADQHDEIGPRDKSSRHGQVTADKWNQ
jgi:hypothetical protein